MIITNVRQDFLADHGRKISVSIVDGGFNGIPQYARIWGGNPYPGHQHGNRILSIFTALDKAHPLQNLELNLSCYDPKTKYDGLAKALGMLPKTDILSISMAWKDDIPEIKELLREKAGIVLAPVPNDPKAAYPSSYKFTVKCSDSHGTVADYCISPFPEWKGSSYAVPAMARLLCYGNGPWINTGIPILDLFSQCKKVIPGSAHIEKGIPLLKCPHCARRLVNPMTHAYYAEKPEKCPYCSRPL